MFGKVCMLTKVKRPLRGNAGMEHQASDFMPESWPTMYHFISPGRSLKFSPKQRLAEIPQQDQQKKAALQRTPDRVVVRLAKKN